MSAGLVEQDSEEQRRDRSPRRTMVAAWSGSGGRAQSHSTLLAWTHLIASALVLLLFFSCPVHTQTGYVDSLSDDLPDYNFSRCVNGYAGEEVPCICYPCWGGSFCQRYEDNYAPRFLVHGATAVVPENITGPVYRAWATDGDLGLTCPLGTEGPGRCPCASVTYQLFAAPGDHRFGLHQDTGVLSRNTSGASLLPGQTYAYKLMVQSLPKRERVQDLQYDILDLKIYISPDYVKIIPWT
ncbi:uncharacterized protein [Procambarus clarkii]|uniref:uncharacterized protein n=1 Tax=Procambarus clarkii TaxID=6728 RepID=UPI003741F65C